MEPRVSPPRVRAVITLQTRDDIIMRTLSLKVRLLSLRQLAAAWWSDSPSGTADARRRLAKLVEAGLVIRHRLPARPLPELTRPVVSWNPNQPPPSFTATAWTLQSRWTAPTCQTSVYIATRRCANQFGGRRRGELKHDYQATHDLGVAAVYLHLLRTDPETAEHWIGEDMLRRGPGRRKIPDAVLAARPDGQVQLVIEFGGAYDAPRVRKFHRHCADRRLPYEIW